MEMYVLAVFVTTLLSLVLLVPWMIGGKKRPSSVLKRTHEKGSHETPLKVAIVGAGVGGASAAYFLHDLHGDSVDIDVYSNHPVGGRMAVIEYDGRQYEAGASVIHKDNLYMSSFAKKFGLTQVYNTLSMPFGIFNGTIFLIKSGFLTPLKLLWRYGLSLLRMERYVNKMLDKFVDIYTCQQKGLAYQTVPDLLGIMGEEYASLTKISAREYLVSELKLNEKLVDELVTAAMKTNYGQTCSTSAFVTMVSLAGMQDNSLWSVLGGNFQIPEKCLEASKATFKKAQVTAITRKEEGEGGKPKYLLAFTPMIGKDDKAGSEEEVLYDAIILAAPLCKCGIQFEGFPNPIYTKVSRQPYHKTIATFLKGQFNPKYFGEECLYRKFPTGIFVSEHQEPPVIFSSIGLQIPVDVPKDKLKEYSKPLSEEPVRIWKIFSNSELTEDDFSSMFSKYEDPVVVPWDAYPEYHPPEEFTSFVLDDCMFYVNCIEHAASVMEMSVIGGRNCVLLLDKSLSES